MLKKIILTLILIIYNLLGTSNNSKFIILNSDVKYIEIPKIKLREPLILDSIFSKEVNGVLIFEEYGRPDKKYSNTIIGAHSGEGNNVYFNNIGKLNYGDEIIINYNLNKIMFKVIDKYETHETDLSPLENIDYKTILTLITCNIFDNSQRIIVVAEQFDG